MVDKEVIELTWRLDEGAPGIDSSLESPLSRAAASLLRRGQPFPHLSMCFFKRNLSSAINRWLGIFVQSDGDRILFFPGTAQKQNYLQGSTFDRDVSSPTFSTDHVSLERDRKSWHLTSPESGDHIGKFPTVDLGESRTFWFAWSVASERQLRLVREDTVVAAAVPSVDAERRVSVLLKALEGAIHSRVSLNRADFRKGGESFLHFAVIVGPKGFPEYDGPVLGIDPNSRFMKDTLPADAFPIPQRSHPIALSSEIELRVICSEVPGKLTIPFVYSAARQ